MGRKKLYTTNAERQRAYRQRNPDRPRNDSNLDKLLDWKVNNPEKWREAQRKREYRKERKKVETKPFIGIDGEGVTRNGKHYYTLLTASDGAYIENWKDGLSTKDCLSFLLTYSGCGILVGFSVNYDINKILKDVDLDSLKRLWEYGETVWDGYVLRWQQSKSFWAYEKASGRTALLYDVFGFFQKSFIKSLEDWKFDVPKEITEGKANRSSFKKSEQAKIRKYNLIECQLLVKLMNKVRDAMIEADALPAHWHGAGAIATALFQRYKVKQHNVMPNSLVPMFCRAYFGGRNQILLQGELDNVWCHDINSAYPYAMAQLPSAVGTWYETEKFLPDNKWSLYYVEWRLDKKEVLTPFPFRHKRAIYWPQVGSGWYWFPEVKEALNVYGSKRIRVLFGYTFVPDNDILPFSFLPDLYAKRKEFLRTSSDGQLILKLGINACYGKVAQSIGYKGSQPAYQNYFWAGYITSVTRSMVFALAAKNPASICSFATDGVVSTDKLAEHSKEKILGAWEVTPAENFFNIQSGVYCFEGEGGKEKIRSRGFSPRSVDYNLLRSIWRKDGVLGEYEYKEIRFIGLGNSLRYNPPLRNWGDWVKQNRKISFYPNGVVDLKPTKCVRVMPHRKIGEVSQEYELKGEWFEGIEGLDHLSDLEQ